LAARTNGLTVFGFDNDHPQIIQSIEEIRAKVGGITYKEFSLAELKDWTLKKIDRDLYNKISFDDERKDATADYNLIKELFSR
jgi:hypothetical protein